MESVAFFEEKVPLTPRDFAAERLDIDEILKDKLVSKLEGKCSLHGWVVPNSVRILSRSLGAIESGRFTGDVVFHVQVEGRVINPPSGAIASGRVIRKNKMGMYVDYRNAIRIILPRDLHIGDEAYEAVEVGRYVECVIRKSRFQVNDEFILSVGDFLRVSGTKDTVNMPAPIPIVEEEEEEKKDDMPFTADDVEEETPAQAVETEAPEDQSGGGEPIEFSSKTPSYQEFSNFYKSNFLLDGKEWPTVEHYFQAQKFQSNPEYQETIRSAKAASKAKSLGASREYPIRNDWDSYRNDVMKKALDAKFSQNATLKEKLVATKNSPLIEATTDPYWGQGRNKKGANKLGLLLMELREKLSAGK